MTAAVPASVILLGQGRPAALARAVLALRLQDHPATELVVVACAAGAAAVERLGLRGQLKLLVLPEGNIARARNRGLQAAAGEVVAFTDAQVVAEPYWLSRLVAAFDDLRVEAATGVQRTRDGRVPTARAAWLDAQGRLRPLEVEAEGTSLHQGAPGSAVCTPATSMAFRRETLAAMGGFDPAFGVALAERDLALRLAVQELITAVVPLAQVQRSAGPPPVRDLRHALFERGAATALFLRKHAPRSDPAPAEAALRRAQRRRLLRAMVAGTVAPGDVARLLALLEAGLAEGRAREIAPLLPIGPPPEPFLPLPGAGPRPARVVAGWTWQAPRLARRARALAAEGAVVTVLRLGPGFGRHRMDFVDGGYWLQRGGLWGRGLHDAAPMPGRGPRARLRAALSPLAAVRPIDTLLG